MEQIKAWHFLPKDRRFQYGDGTKAEVGYVYSVAPPIEMCRWGLHASAKACDALRYAPGPVVGRVLLSGEIAHGDDKLCATHREYLWIADATDALRAHARWCAMQVIELWDAPDVVRRYLESGDESLRAEAKDAARATRYASEDAAMYAAWAAEYAARATMYAMHAAMYAAWVTRYEQNTDLESRLFALGAPK